MSQDPSTVLESPEFLDFLLQVKQVLENFYNFPFLNTHLLSRTCLAPRLRPSETDGQRLRRVFLEGFESLKPESEVVQRLTQGRFFSLLNLRYVESYTVQQVAHELGVSERQAYRDLKRAEEQFANLIWDKFDHTPGSMEKKGPAGEEVEETVELMYGPVSVQELATNAVHAVERLAQQMGIELVCELPAEPITLYTDARLAQQVIINLISQLLQIAKTRAIHLRALEVQNQLTLTLEYEIEPDQVEFPLENPFAAQFAQKLGWKLEFGKDDTRGVFICQLIAADHETILLAIDDHPPLIELLRRYLINTRCQVVGVSNGQEGLELARSLLPDVILLDVMMPGIDGWEVLQRLRNLHETAQIPVVICSIFNDPKLAYSLGATALLTKPVKREELFEVLRSLKILG